MYRFAVAAIVMFVSTTASAGTYLGLGIGTGGSVNGDFDQSIGLQQDGRSGRLMVGYAFGRFAVEGLGTSYDLDRATTTTFNVKQAAVAAKYNYPLGDNFEVFGRAGLARTWLTGDGEFDGNGYLIGAGFEYRLKLAIAAGTIFIDWTRTTTTLDDGSGAYMYETAPSMWTAGLTVSL
jgi:hypothetical protein